MKQWQVGAIALIATIIGLSIGIGASYLIVNNAKKEEPKPVITKQADEPTININTTPAATSVTNSRLIVTQDSTSPTASPEEKWTGEITLAPKNALQMKKEVSKTTNIENSEYRPDGKCGNSGFVTFSDLKSEYKMDGDSNSFYKNKMVILNKNLPFEDKTYGDNIFQTEIEYINNGKYKQKNGIYDATSISTYDNSEINFITGCRLEYYGDGFFVNLPKPLTNLANYEKGVYGINAQGLFIKAKKNDNIVYITGKLDILDQNELQKCAEKFPTPPQGYVKEAVDCFAEKIKSKAGYQKAVDDKVQELLTIFAL